MKMNPAKVFEAHQDAIRDAAAERYAAALEERSADPARGSVDLMPQDPEAISPIDRAIVSHAEKKANIIARQASAFAVAEWQSDGSLWSRVRGAVSLVPIQIRHPRSVGQADKLLDPRGGRIIDREHPRDPQP